MRSTVWVLILLGAACATSEHQAAQPSHARTRDTKQAYQCREERPVGSMISRTVCQPVRDANARRQFGKDYIDEMTRRGIQTGRRPDP